MINSSIGDKVGSHFSGKTNKASSEFDAAKVSIEKLLQKEKDTLSEAAGVKSVAENQIKNSEQVIVRLEAALAAFK